MAEKPSGLPPSRMLGVPFSVYDDDNVLEMLKTDLSTFKRHPFFPVSPGITPPFRADAPQQSFNSNGGLCEYIPAVNETVLFGRSSSANKLLPQKERENESKESAWKFGELSKDYKDAGVGKKYQRGVREYLASGYTRRNPDGKTDHDTDWRGKWKERNFQVAEYTWWKADKKLAGDSFGDPAKDWASGEYKLGALEGDGKAGFSVTKGGIDAKLSAKASAAAAQGKVEVLKDQVISGAAKGAVLKGELEGEVAFVGNPEEVTGTLKLAAKANVIEGSVNGELCLTPSRVGNPVIKAWNWLFEEHNQLIEDKWDIGVCLGGELQGAVGAQAEASAEAGVKKGKARAEVGAKLGFGLGGGAKVSGGLTGLDKAADLIKGWPGK